MLILASASPRRRKLLKTIAPSFKVVPSLADESIISVPPHELAAELSRLKAYEVHRRYPHDEILSCDTIVILKDRIYGKPKDEKDARRMLRELSGQRHVVISGYTYLSEKKEITRSVRTDVYFNKLSDELIEAYVKTGSPLDKAGAYGIQDQEFPLVDHINGSLMNVIGLPIEDIRQHVFNN